MQETQKPVDYGSIGRGKKELGEDSGERLLEDSYRGVNAEEG